MPIIEALGGEASRDCQAYLGTYAPRWLSLDEYYFMLSDAYIVSDACNSLVVIISTIIVIIIIPSIIITTISMHVDEYDRLLNEAYPIVKLQNKYHSQGIYVTILTYRRFFLTCKL